MNWSQSLTKIMLDLFATKIDQLQFFMIGRVSLDKIIDAFVIESMN